MFSWPLPVSAGDYAPLVVSSASCGGKPTGLQWDTAGTMGQLENLVL